MSRRGDTGLPEYVERLLTEEMLRYPDGSKQSWRFPMVIGSWRVPNSPNPELNGFMIAFPDRGASWLKVVLPALHRLLRRMGLSTKYSLEGHLFDDWQKLNSPRKFVLEGTEFVEVTRPEQYTAIANRKLGR